MSYEDKPSTVVGCFLQTQEKTSNAVRYFLRSDFYIPVKLVSIYVVLKCFTKPGLLY